MEAKLEQLTKQIAALATGGVVAVKTKPPATGGQHQKQGGKAEAGATPDDEDPLKSEVAELEFAIKQCVGENMAEFRKQLESQLKEVRVKIEERKPGLTKHCNVGHRLSRATAKHDKIVQELAERDKCIADLQAERAEVEARRVATEAEFVELRKQHVQSLPIHGAAGGDTLEVPQELLEGKAEIQQMLESKVFKEFAQIYQTYATPKAAADNGDNGGSNRGATYEDGGAVPVPMDAEFDEAFEDIGAAETFWEKHKGDKRAILEALLSAKVKRLRTSQL